MEKSEFPSTMSEYTPGSRGRQSRLWPPRRPAGFCMPSRHGTRVAVHAPERTLSMSVNAVHRQSMTIVNHELWRRVFPCCDICACRQSGFWEGRPSTATVLLVCCETGTSGPRSRSDTRKKSDARFPAPPPRDTAGWRAGHVELDLTRHKPADKTATPAYTAQRLRDAVWREILGPPVGLREEGRSER